MEVAAGGPAFMVDETAIDPAVFGLTSYAAPTAAAPRVARKIAIQVPAVKRVRDLIAGTIGQLPVELYGADRRVLPCRLFEQPERSVPRSVTMTRLVEDMLFEGRAWWRILDYDNGFPSTVKRMPPLEVSVNEDSKRCASGDPTCSGAVTYKGEHLHDSEVICFDSPNDALLVAAARAIRTCLALESATYRYADGAPPLDYFTPADSSFDPDEDEVTESLNKWGEARRTRSTGYVPSALKYNIAGWSPEQLELGDARQAARLEIAVAGGVDPEEVGVSTTSRTYANQFDRRKQFTDFTLGDYMVAIQERLSMGDVTRPGQTARFNLSTFLRSDDKTRYETYEVGVRVGAIDGPAEVRQLEGKPALTQEAPVPATTAQGFDTDTTMEAGAPGGTVFAVDPETRTIRGRAVPYGVVGVKNGLRFQFSQGKVHPREGMKVKLWALHDKTQASGVVTEWTDTPEGLDVAFRVAKTPEGDKALQLAADEVWDGLSIGPSEGAKYELRDGVYHAVDIPIHEISLTPAPVFGGARVQSVAFDAEKGNPMKCTKCGVVHADGVAECQAADLTAFKASKAGTDFSAITDAITAGFATLANPQAAAQREVVNPTGAQVQVNEPSPYRFDGAAGEHSFSQDIRDAYMSGDAEARQRLETFIEEAFAVTTANVGALNPTQNRPDLYVPNLTYNRPLWDLVSTGTIEDKTPFTVPRFSSAAGLVGNHTEGVEPTPGSFAATSQTVTPAPLSGKIEIVREVWDQGGSPQADGIIWGEMLNGWFEAIEAKIAALLATTATAELNLAGAVDAPLQDALVNYFAGLQFVRGGNRFTATAADSKLFLALTAAKGTDGRKLFPVLGPTNATGQTTEGFESVNVGSQRIAAAWALAQGANTRSYNFVPSSVWAWASAPKKFTFEYQVKSIDMAIWGYWGGAILRDSDVKPIDYDTSDA